ncbi:hypothetical protein [Seonamhaeicola sp.]|uniref:hypothetical protein n=1 Tax=Seonamhaeicola sp. TaxID=1912245 RepID=UPI002611FF66|nr:hypothetical protein [Seonamhaeicola sp.]
MKQLITFFIIVISLSSFHSCARMVVNVSTADSDRVQEEGEKYIDRMKAYAFVEIKPLVFACDLFDSDKMNTYISKDIKEGIAVGTIASDDEAILKTNIKSFTDAAIKVIQNTYKQATALTEQKKYSEAVDRFWDSYNLVEQLKKDIKHELDNSDAANSIEAIECFSVLYAEAASGDRFNLLGDPMVSYITKEENLPLWESTYNRTKSSTFFGNADIAVVLQEDPESYNNNYAIKGVRVDADKLIQSSFDVLAQSINVVASSQGIALPDKGEQNYFYPDVIPEIQNLATEKNKLADKRKEYEAYRKLLIVNILNKNLDNKSGEELKTAIDEIKALWATYKAKMASN